MASHGDDLLIRVVGVLAWCVAAIGCDTPVEFPDYRFRDAASDLSGDGAPPGDAPDDRGDDVETDIGPTPCDKSKDRCDGICVDLRANPAHCGACDHVCAFANAAPTCVSGACVLGTCLDGFGDCDGAAANGCETDLRTAAMSCGACGAACTFANASATCASGVCAFGACAEGFGDCDALPANGCETDLRTASTNCGACGTTCSFANATAVCVDRSCRLERCASGFGDCDMTPANGCEAALTTDARNCGACGRECTGATPFCSTDSAGTACVSGCPAGQMRCSSACVDPQSSVDHCGACGNACPSRANTTTGCAAGRCGYACAAGFADCDGDATNGCEVNLGSDVMACNGCRSPCSMPNATPACVGSVCRVAACSSGWGNCDGIDSNGCETHLDSLANCNGCRASCNRSNATATCSGQSCRISSCLAGWGNCDGVDSNGCEARLNTVNNCGRCGLALAETRCDGLDDNCNLRVDEGDVCASTVPFGGSIQVGARSGARWSTVMGDNEFGGHGPCVTATATVTRSVSDVSIRVCVDMWERNGTDCGGSTRDSHVYGCALPVSRPIRNTGFQPTQQTTFTAQYFDRTTNSVDGAIPVSVANRSILRVDCNGDTNNEDVCYDQDFPGCSGCIFYLGDVRVYRAP